MAILSFRWAIRLAVTGDLRFCSHHDMMRAIERLAVRSRLPLHYSQGFNPRPVISLPAARPVGIAGESEILCINFDAELDSAELLDSLNRNALPGMIFESAMPLATAKATPQITAIVYSMKLAASEVTPLSHKVDELKNSEQWLIHRSVKPSSRRGGRNSREESFVDINLKPRVDVMEICGENFTFTLVPCGDSWAKPCEVLALAGIGGPKNVARLHRVEVRTD